ncbi:MAG: hypothetical protein AB1568_04660 [Thermodesulfobacteriota bacterium]
MRRVPTFEQIVRAMQIKGNRVFDSTAGYNLNLVGIRAMDGRPDRFDDLLAVFHRRGAAWCGEIMACTTDPGLYWLNNPEHIDGTAILKPGQYRGAFRLGYHRGKYEALTQAGPLTVWRDNNRDDRMDTAGQPEHTGMFGINIHRAADHGESTVVGRWSAGCQVVANWWDFSVLIAMAKAGAHSHGNSFTYTLLEERDLGVV